MEQHVYLDKVSVHARPLGEVEKDWFFLRVQTLTHYWETPPRPLIFKKVGGEGSGDYREVDLSDPSRIGTLHHGKLDDHVLVLPYPPRHH